MSTFAPHRMFTTSLGAVLLAAASAACTADPTSSGSGTPSSDDAGSTTTPPAKTDGGKPPTAPTDGGTITPPVSSCQDFGFGSTPIRGTDIIAKCDTFPPTNCKTGSYLWFDDSNKAGSCYCRVDCDDFDPVKKVGAACDNNGQTICTTVRSKDGASGGNTCLTKAWQDLNLCK